MGIEVRTTQEYDGEEIIGVVFSIRASVNAPVAGTNSWVSTKHSKVVKVTQYVEKADDGSCQFYIVLHTQEGNVIVTEMLRNGTTTWVENPVDWEGRNSLAKIMRYLDFLAGISVGDLKTFCSREAGQSVSSPSQCKRFAEAVYDRVAHSIS